MRNRSNELECDGKEEYGDKAGELYISTDSPFSAPGKLKRKRLETHDFLGYYKIQYFSRSFPGTKIFTTNN